ncbi:MAG: TonB-dependent receptor [Bacteroidales bacterium]|nr:TonB-dependent receptor [Bacteroidales bacterium]
MCLLSIGVWAQNYPVSGQVLDEDGVPLIGASVIIEGADDVSTQGTITDIDGNFSLEVKADDQLKVSYVGYVTQVIPVEGRKTISVTLVIEATELTSVVVVGYGVQKKETLVGAISQAKGEEVVKMGTPSSISQSLQGMLPGVTGVVNSGQPGSENANLTIRGISTWQGTNEPLVLVDGIERNMNEIDPNEIESISVLKDASATAVFGVKGGDGVILITTKRGTISGAKVSFSTNIGIKQPTQTTEFADRVTTMEWYNKAAANDGEWGKLFPESEIEAWRQAYADGNIGPYNDYFPVIDWWDEMIKDYGITQNYNLNLRGGNEYVRYFTSLGYLNDGDIVDVEKKDDFDPRYYYKRYNWRSNFDFNLTKTTQLGLNLSGSYSIKNLPLVGGGVSQYFNNFYRVSPSDFPIQWEDGTYGTSGEGIGNISHLVYQGQLQYKEFRGFVDLTLTQKLDFVTKGLKVMGRVSYNANSKTKTTINMFANSGAPESQFGDNNTVDNFWRDFDYSNPIQNADGTVDYPILDEGRYPIDPEFFGSVPGVGRDAWDGYNRRQYQELRLSYDRKFGKHDISAMFSTNRNERNTGGGIPRREQDNAGRIKYGYASRYFIEVNGAYNGFENVAPGQRYGFFPSASMGWRLSEESFIKERIGNVLTNFKVRYSYGQSGKAFTTSNERWPYMQLYIATDADGHRVLLGESSRFKVNSVAYIEGRPANINATWETSTKQNLGFEFGLLNKFRGTVDLFKENREDILMDRQLALWNNTQNAKANMGETKNRGIEIDLRYNNSIGEHFRYGIDGNMLLVENRIVFRDDGKNTLEYERQAGKPIGFQRRYIAHEYYQDLDDVFNGPVTTNNGIQSRIMPGDILYVDYNGDGTITDGSEDQAVMKGQNKPFKTYSFGFSFGYKGLALKTRFYGIWDVYSNVPHSILYDYLNIHNDLYSAKPDVVNSWTPDNRDNAIKPVLHTEDNVTAYSRKYSNWTYQDRSYLRLKNVEVSYTFKDLRMSSGYTMPMLNLYVNGNNLYTWTGFNDRLDPESGGTGSYPMIRRFNIGIKATF